MVHVRDLVMRLRSAAGVVTILDGVSLDVAPGEFVAVTGPSGSGKSTLLGLIAGLDRPTAGSIRVDGVELASLDEDALARLRLAKIGYVFQSFHLIPTLTALENVAIPLDLAGVPDAADRARAPSSRKSGSSCASATTPPSCRAASSSEWRWRAPSRTIRVSCSRTSRPGNLDSATGAQIIDLLAGLHRRHGITLILVTHDPALAAHARRVVELRDGRVVADRAIA